MSNYLAPDGYRYGIRFQDGSVSSRYNGRTQRRRNLHEIFDMVMDQMSRVGRCDRLELVRRKPEGEWEKVG